MATPRYKPSLNFSLNDHVWIGPVTKGEWDVPKAVKVLLTSGDQLKVVDNDNQICWVNSASILKPLHPTSLSHVEDMITLGELEEYTILHNLHLRYKKNIIYTYIGMMLVAINPYQDLPLYGEAELRRYREKRAGAHIYALGSQSYDKMRRHGTNQCIVISGESGAGKTESTKLLLKFLTELSGQNSNIEQQLILANPILEGFGNAKTVRNDNSSRFGKYIVISYTDDGVIAGACIQPYLLEKSRVTSLGPGNRNYHVFYSLAAGLNPQEKTQLSLGPATNYTCLTAGGTIESEGRNEADEFKEMRQALRVLNYSDEEVWEMFKLLAAILHLCNVQLKPSSEDKNDTVTVPNIADLERVQRLLQVDKTSLLKTLTKKTLQVEGEVVVSDVTKTQAIVMRDAFARALYYRLFIYIVDKINKAIFKHNTSNNRSIGILDIFGFEDFDNNSFEQLCINYANEHLQQFFVKHIFKLEQEEYKREQISWTPVAFDDNERILQLISGDRINIFSTTDDLSRLPSGTDASLVMKSNKNHEKNPFYVRPKSDISPLFGIRHYAGTVTYNVEGFLEKNRNTLSSDWVEMLRSSQNALLKTLFVKDLATTQPDHVRARGQTQTVLSQYRASLETLMAALTQCQPFFIRCIKPNDFKQPNMFDQSFCCRQLRHSGLMDTAKIRSMGFPIRLSFADFIHRYRLLVPGIPPANKVADPRQEAVRICRAVLSNEGHQLGQTKVFLRQRQSTLLELERDKLLEKSVTTLQKHLRASQARSRFLRMRAAALTVQKHWRGRRPRQQFQLIRQGYLRLQALIRSRVLKASFAKLRDRVTGIQARCRGFLIRREKKNNAVQENPVVDGSIDQWITSIFEAAVEGSEDIFPPSDRPQSPSKKVEFSLPTQRDRIPLRISESEPDAEAKDRGSEAEAFSRFAAEHFRGNVSYQFSKRPLKQSLLDLPLPADQVAALALWVTILRFMGDLPEPQTTQSALNSSVMSVLSHTLSKSVTNSKEYFEAIQLLKYENSAKDKRKLVNLSLEHKNKLKKELARGKLEGSALKASYSQWLDHTRSNILQKLHFIIGHGILRPELRDEIYSQVCKQLSNNPSAASRARGWALMALCVGCFTPSPRLATALHRFLASAPPPYNRFYCYRLQRTLQNGTRSQPPSWHELNAIRNQQSMTLAVNLSDGSVQYMEADSAITAEEICSQLADHIGLQDRFGFSLFITVFGEVMRLEAGRFHVMDAVSQCEQDAKERGVAERDTPWQLVYRKEMFAPWQGLALPDPVATNLIYRQVVKAVKNGEYRCSEDSELALLAAQQYYIDHGIDLVPVTLARILPEYIPARQLKQPGTAYWEGLVTDTFKKSYFVKDRVPEGMVKADVVNFSKTKWPLLFSKYYEATQISGPDMGATHVVLAVNSSGVSIVTNSERVLLQLSFLEIHSISQLPQEAEKEKQQQQFQLVTVQGYEFVYESAKADVVTELVQWIISSLKEISKYFIAVQDYTPPVGGGLLSMKKGDLIALEEGERGGEWLTGYNVLTREWGEFPTASVRVLPTVLQPPLHIVEYFNKEGALDGTLRAKAIQKIMPVENKHTLEQYSKKHFRLPLGSEELWKHSTQPLALPLLRSLQPQPLKDKAVTGFMAVLKYTGDLPSSKQSDPTEAIFQGPVDHEILRDELYCQLMRQLTHNGSATSEERAWELMCLVAGLFAPSSEILKELRLFLSSREHPLACDSLQRLEYTLSHGYRKHPPHWTEVQAMQQRVPITHTICFPNHTEQRFEVNSTTRIGDLIEQIGDRLNFHSTEGFSLVVSICDKTAALANEEFLFDAVQEICSWAVSDSSLKKSQSQKFVYELMFMRKIWLTMVPGKDRIADVTCHYPQETPKYILGYQKCSKSDGAVLGALLFRAEYGDNKLNLLDDSKKVMSKLVPPYHLKLQSAKEWKKAISYEYRKQNGMSSEDAKINYLKLVFPWSTFGSSFFDVKVKAEGQRFPENITIAINKNGIFILNRETREPLTLYPFTELTTWNSTASTFTLRVGSVTLNCYTTLGYKMDDLITSYSALVTLRNSGL